MSQVVQAQAPCHLPPIHCRPTVAWVRQVAGERRHAQFRPQGFDQLPLGIACSLQVVAAVLVVRGVVLARGSGQPGEYVRHPSTS